MSAFVSSLLPERFHPIAFYLGLILACVGLAATFAKLPVGQQLASSGVPKILIVITGTGFLFALSWQILGASDQVTKVAAGPNANFALLPPNHRYTLDWDPKKLLHWATRPDLGPGEDPPDGSRIPYLRIKNFGDRTAESVVVNWRLLEKVPVKNLIATSARLKNFVTRNERGALMLTKTSDSGTNTWVVRYSNDGTSAFQFFAPSIDNEKFQEIHFPAQVWAAVECAIVSSLPEFNATTITQLPAWPMVQVGLAVEVGWTKPQPKKQEFIVNIQAKSVKPMSNVPMKMEYKGEWREPPELMTEISFTVQKTEE